MEPPLADDKDQDVNDVLSAAYDEQEKVAATEAPVEADVNADIKPDIQETPEQKIERERDEKGRFAAKEAADRGGLKPGEKVKPDLAKEADIKPDTTKVAEIKAEIAAPKVEPPKHWAAKDKDTFSKAPAEVQKWLLDRSKSQDADYT